MFLPVQHFQVNKIQKIQVLKDFHHKAASADYGSLRVSLVVFCIFVVVIKGWKSVISSILPVLGILNILENNTNMRIRRPN